MSETVTATTGDGAVGADASLHVGNRVLASRYVLSPLAGYTQLAFRRALRELGGLGMATTDLVHATQLTVESRKSTVLVTTTPDDRPLSVQIFGSVPEPLVKAAKWLEDRGYEGVDLNMGCPMAKVNGQGGGARLMCSPDATCELVAQVVQAVRIPVTVKMRLGWDRDSISAPYFAKRFEEAGVAAITVHGRTRAQGFAGDVDLDGIAATVGAVTQIPVFGNGDVRTAEEARRMERLTGCQGVAIGRGAMLDPWIFRKLNALARGEPAVPPTDSEKHTFLIRHFELMAEQHGERACTLLRKFASWYGATLGLPPDLEDRLRRFETATEFREICDEFRERPGPGNSRIATALIKVPNGPVEHW